MPSSNRATHYHRFIPSEEVVEVAAWEFAPVDGSPAASKAAASEATPPPPSNELLEEAKQQAYNQGFDDGRHAGAQEARKALEPLMQQELRQLAQRLSGMVEHAHADMTRLEDTLAAQMLELACDLARQVVRTELATPQDSLRQVVHEALTLAIEDGRPATVKVHPDDAEWLQAGWNEAQPNVRLVTDDAITPGGCRVESAQGSVDATVEKRWARAVANLGLNTPWAPGEQADV